MALNVTVFKTRALTAVVFVVVMMAGLLISKWGFLALFVVIHFGCWWEYVKLIRLIKPVQYVYYLPLGLLYITMPCLMLMDVAGIMMAEKSAAINAGCFGSFPFIAFYILPCGIIFSIWINDTMAYIVGSLTGKTPFSKISPKKTWEGTGGGALLCVIVIAVAGYFSEYYTIKDWAIIAAICAIFGTAGDLLESKLKRLAGVKDSGSFMPGHGGFLDRFDSLLVAVPFVWMYVKLFV
jgi:phosphatidate cytidylyltransferase